MRWVVLCAAALVASSCDLDLTDPNNPKDEIVLTDPNGLKSVGVGLQAEYGNELVDPVYVDALVMNYLGAISAAFESYRRVDEGLSIDNDLGPSTETWAGMYDVVNLANILLENVPNVTFNQTGTSDALLALAKLFKAMAFGHLLQVYERIPLEVGLDENDEPIDAVFVTRAEAFAEVFRLLNEARQHITTTPPSAEFNEQVLAPGISLLNTIDAMIARYSLINGDLTGALTAAQRVTAPSEMQFSSADQNPLWVMFLGSGNAFRLMPEDRFRTQAQAGDQRVAYWVTASTSNTASNAASPLDSHRRYGNPNGATVSWPIYTLDEMRLIQAEVYARQNNLIQALALLNQVRQHCPPPPPGGTEPSIDPGACLPALLITDVPTQAAMLDAIYRERQYELYLMGLHWSDARRFGRPLKYEFLMVSRPECERNSNAPAEVCQTTTMPES
jgi:hypothetical protein